MKLFSNIKGDIMGGITTSVIALPLAIAFGVVAFAPLGEEYIAQGALTGLYGVIVAGILNQHLRRHTRANCRSYRPDVCHGYLYYCHPVKGSGNCRFG